MAPGSGLVGRPLGIRVTVGHVDRLRGVTWLAFVTLAVGIVSATLGRPPFRIPFDTHVILPVCPACGLTRGTVATLRGHFTLGFRYNPLAPLVPLVAVGILARTVVGVIWGRWLDVRYRPTRLAWVLGAASVVALWAYQLTRVDFLLHSRVV